MENQVILEAFFRNIQIELSRFIDKYDYKSFEKAAQIIIDSQKQGGRVHVSGIGKPSHVSSYIASLLSSTGTPAYFLDATEAVHGSAGQVKKNDVVIVISNSGKTKELLYTVETLKINHAKIIAVTQSEQSPLSHLASVTLVAGVEQEGDNLNKPPRGSIIMEILALQALSLYLQNEKNLDLKTYLKWHPGGSIGETKL